MTTPNYAPDHTELTPLAPLMWKELLLNPVDSAVKTFILINKINELEQDIKEYNEDAENYEIEIDEYQKQLAFQKTKLERYPLGIRKIYTLGENLNRYPAILFYPAKFLYLGISGIALAAVFAFRAFAYFIFYSFKDMGLHFFIDLFSGDLLNDALANREDSLFPAAKTKYLNEVRHSDINFVDLYEDEDLIRAMQRKDNAEGWVTSEDYEIDEIDERITRNLVPRGKTYLRLVRDAIHPIIFQSLPTETSAKAFAVALWPLKFLGGILLMGLAILLEGMQKLTDIAILGLAFMAAAATASILTFVNLPLFVWDTPEYCRDKIDTIMAERAAKKALNQSTFDKPETSYNKLLTSGIMFTKPQTAPSTPVPASAQPASTGLTDYTFLNSPQPVAVKEKPYAPTEKRATLVV